MWLDMPGPAAWGTLPCPDRVSPTEGAPTWTVSHPLHSQGFGDMTVDQAFENEVLRASAWRPSFKNHTINSCYSQ